MVEYAEHVGLVLGGVDGPMQLDVILGTDQPGVVTRTDRVEAERDAALQHGRELDLLVAADAGLGVRPAAYSATKSFTTSAAKRSERSHT